MKTHRIKITYYFKFLLSLILLLCLCLSLIACTSEKPKSSEKSNPQEKSSSNENIEENATEAETSAKATKKPEAEESTTKPSPSETVKETKKKSEKAETKESKENASPQEKEENSELSAYKKAIKNFAEVSIKELRELAAKAKADEVYYAYLGAESCPFCTLLAPVLAELKEEHNLNVLFIDSDKNGSEEDLIDDFIEFIEEKDLSTIPALFIVKNQDIQQVKVKPPYTVGKLEKLLELSK